MKKKYIAVIGVVALLAVAAIGGTLASGYVESKKKLEADISEKSLDVAIVGDENDGAKDVLGTNMCPGSEIELNRSIKNVANNGYDIYACVNIYYDWNYDDADESHKGESIDINDVYENKVFSLLLNDKELIINKNLEDAKPIDGWLLVESTPGQITMYYTKPIKASDNAVSFLDKIKLDVNMGNEYAGAILSLSYEVKAVQAGNKNVEVAKKAIAAEWGVFASIDDMGNITAISETRVEE